MFGPSGSQARRPPKRRSSMGQKALRRPRVRGRSWPAGQVRPCPRPCPERSLERGLVGLVGRGDPHSPTPARRRSGVHPAPSNRLREGAPEAAAPDAPSQRPRAYSPQPSPGRARQASSTTAGSSRASEFASGPSLPQVMAQSGRVVRSRTSRRLPTSPASRSCPAPAIGPSRRHRHAGSREVLDLDPIPHVIPLVKFHPPFDLLEVS